MKGKDCFQYFWHGISRRKKIPHDVMATPLRRCLTTTDLTMYGIGNMLGSGIYVLTGTVIRDKAGPAAIISYMIAGVTAFLDALCYAEMGARIPKAGSAYVYTYVAVGELLAFIVGWSIILEYVLSASSVASGWSATVNLLSNGAVANGTITYIGQFPTTSSFISKYPDLLALGIVIVLMAILLTGPKQSLIFNSIITGVNICVLIIANILMFSGGNISNLNNSVTSGFMPYGIHGVVSAGATCFYSFIGFDGITTSLEETINPNKSLPIAAGLSVAFVGLLFVITTLGICYYVPWMALDRGAVLLGVFYYHNMPWAVWLMGVGSLFGITASLFTALYALPRIVYSMASDGTIYRCFSHVISCSKMPAIALIVFSLIAGLFAVIFDISTLADFLSLGTLIAFSFVAVNIVVLRFNKPEYGEPKEKAIDNVDKSAEISKKSVNELNNSEDALLITRKDLTGTLKPYFAHFPLLNRGPPGLVPTIALALYTCFTALTCVLGFAGTSYLLAFSPWAIILLVIFIIIAILSFCVMLMFEQDKTITSFQMPFVPFIPCVCILLNFTLIANLSPLTWLRFTIWLVIGFVIYFTYGICTSNGGESEKAFTFAEFTTSYGATKKSKQPLAATLKGDVSDRDAVLHDTNIDK